MVDAVDLAGSEADKKRRLNEGRDAASGKSSLRAGGADKRADSGSGSHGSRWMMAMQKGRQKRNRKRARSDAGSRKRKERQRAKAQVGWKPPWEEALAIWVAAGPVQVFRDCPWHAEQPPSSVMCVANAQKRLWCFGALDGRPACCGAEACLLSAATLRGMSRFGRGGLAENGSCLPALGARAARPRRQSLRALGRKEKAAQGRSWDVSELLEGVASRGRHVQLSHH